MKFSRDQRARTFDALQTIASEEKGTVDRKALDRVFDAAEWGERAAIAQLERVNGVITNWLRRNIN